MPAKPTTTGARSPFARGGAAAGSSFSPDIVQAQTGAPPPSVSSRSAFQYYARPERWQVVEGRVLPTLCKQMMQPGVGGVEEGASGRISIRHAKGMLEERGCTLIPFEQIPQSHKDELGFDTYLWKPEGRPDVTLSIYERVFPGSKDVRPDSARWVEFLTHLVESGIVPMAPDYVLGKMLDVRRERLAAHYARLGQNPHEKVSIDRVEAEIEAIETELSKRNSKRKPARGRSAKPELE